MVWLSQYKDDITRRHYTISIKRLQNRDRNYTDKKENQIFLIYKEILSGAVAKSYMRKGFPIYEEMRKYYPIYEEAVRHILLCNCSTLNFLLYEENLIIFFISVGRMQEKERKKSKKERSEGNRERKKN
jgi:hypothetical protein